MAAAETVRAYLACWFQLNKGMVHHPSGQRWCPQPVLAGEMYSPAFEATWEAMTTAGREACYLEGTPQTLADLLSPAWEVTACGRCQMPVPMPIGRRVGVACPCADLPLWPQFDLPQPHAPVQTDLHLARIQRKLASG